MLHANTYQHQCLVKERLQDSIRRAETDALCREAGLDPRGWTERQACRGMAHLGSFLILLGRRLQEVELPPVTSRSLQRTG